MKKLFHDILESFSCLSYESEVETSLNRLTKVKPKMAEIVGAIRCQLQASVRS